MVAITVLHSCRRQLNEIVELIIHESMASDLSDSDSSEDEEMIAAIMLELALAPKVALGPRLNLDDLSPLECEQLFRSVIKNTRRAHRYRPDSK